MSHHRCYVDPAVWNGSELSLSLDEEHHLLDVMRALPGDVVTAFDGRGHECTAVIAELPGEMQKRRGPRIVLRVVSAIEGTRPACEFILFQAIPKGKTMEWIIEKAVELGASAIIPFISERVIVRLGPDERKERRARWERIAVGAAKQCGTPVVPGIHDIVDYRSGLSTIAGCDLVLVGSLLPSALPLREVMRTALQRATPRRVAIIIGPEGDLTEGELAAAMDSGAIPVSFGSLVFRVETASLFALSVLLYELGGRADPPTGA